MSVVARRCAPTSARGAPLPRFAGVRHSGRAAPGDMSHRFEAATRRYDRPASRRRSGGLTVGLMVGRRRRAAERSRTMRTSDLRPLRHSASVVCR
jgi:hypothetical protein